MINQKFPDVAQKIENFGISPELASVVLAVTTCLPLFWLGNVFFGLAFIEGAKIPFSVAFIFLLSVVIQSVLFPLLEFITGNPPRIGTIFTAAGMVIVAIIGYKLNQIYS